MQAVNEAWFVLRDPGRKARYDAELGGEQPRRAQPAWAPEPEDVAAAFLVEEPPPAPAGPPRAADAVVLMPPALVLGGIALLVFSTMTMSTPLLVLAFGLLLVGGVSFLLAPFLLLARQRRHR